MKGDSWFGSVKAAAELGARGMHGIFQVKTSHTLFPKTYFEDALAHTPGGVHIVLRGRHPNGSTLFALGYRYSSKKTLCFIMTDGAGSTVPGTPYEMKYTDDYGNVGKYFDVCMCNNHLFANYNHYFIVYSEIRYVDRPQVISSFFRDSNGVDRHNHVRQGELGLESKWVTHNPWFRLATTLVGMNVTDTWQLMNHHRLFPHHVAQRYNVSDSRTVPVKAFAGSLAAQLFKRVDMMEDRNSDLRKRTIDDVDVSFSDNEEEDDGNDIVSGSSVEGTSDGEYSFMTSVGYRIDKCREVMTVKDGNDNNHLLCKFPVIQTGTGKKMKKRSNVQNCSICAKQTTFFCFHCQKPYCYSLSDKGHG